MLFPFKFGVMSGSTIDDDGINRRTSYFRADYVYSNGGGKNFEKKCPPFVTVCVMGTDGYVCNDPSFVDYNYYVYYLVHIRRGKKLIGNDPAV